MAKAAASPAATTPTATTPPAQLGVGLPSSTAAPTPVPNGPLADGVQYAQQLDPSKGWGNDNLFYQPPQNDTFGSGVKGVTLPPWANTAPATPAAPTSTLLPPGPAPVGPGPAPTGLLPPGPPPTGLPGMSGPSSTPIMSDAPLPPPAAKPLTYQQRLAQQLGQYTSTP